MTIPNKIKSFVFRKLEKIDKKIRTNYRVLVLGDVFPREVRRWFRDDGDNTLRLDYDLNENSVVVDVGGYIGDFAAQISEKYRCYVYIFEPSQEFYERCVLRFAGNTNIKCFNFGLGNVDGEFSLSDQEDASSIKLDGISSGTKTVQIRRFSDVYKEIGLGRISLLKVNIEGGEYDLIPHIIDEGLVIELDNIQIQFHDFIENAKKSREDIVERLQVTHLRDWCYTFVWENWSLKK